MYKQSIAVMDNLYFLICITITVLQGLTLLSNVIRLNVTPHYRLAIATSYG